MELLGRLARGVGHDFNNLVSAILCYCRLVERQLPKGGQAAEDLAEIRAAAKRGAFLARLLMAFSNMPTSRESEPVELGDGVSTLLRLLGHAFERRDVVRFVPPTRPVLLKGNVLELVEILLEILVPALEGNGSPSRIAIRFEDTPTDAESPPSAFSSQAGSDGVLAVSIEHGSSGQAARQGDDPSADVTELTERVAQALTSSTGRSRCRVDLVPAGSKTEVRIHLPAAVQV